ncbi:MAG TPA: ABC transporter permease [Vicinamibacteria bacterium]|nr:ABC transporter permease [Vicinamibacteria bacterium]
MDIHETLRVALRAIRRNKVRSALTMLGVIIGVASVIAMIALGSGARASIDQQIQSQGTALIYLSSGSFGGPGRAHQGSGSVQTLTIEDAEAVAREIPTIARWTPGVRGRSQVIAGNNNWNTQVEGGNEDFLAVRNWEVAEGANFTARDVLVAEKVCLLGATVARTLFPDSDPVGQIIRVRNMPFRVLGVLRAKGQGQWGQDQDDFVVAPWTTVQRKLLGINYIHQVSLTARSSELVEPTAVAITRLMRARHRITNPENDDFSVRTVEEMAATRVQMAETMTGLLMSVASVSLLVGGIGIMNIMLVSVTERTREIGVRMAVGAKTRDVMRQFLAEAIALSLVGGLAGILLGVAVSETITHSLGWPVAITTASIVIAFAFSAAVGIFFGWYPARKAANLDPIEALRYE